MKICENNHYHDNLKVALGGCFVFWIRNKCLINKTTPLSLDLIISKVKVDKTMAGFKLWHNVWKHLVTTSSLALEDILIIICI